ncbi:hypothetical protein [Rubritalea tangerina]
MVSNWMEGHTSNRILILRSYEARSFYHRSFTFRYRRGGSHKTLET